MSKQIQLRRGTADEHETFIGADGEVTVDTTNKTLRVHDGVTPGGSMLARAGEGLSDITDYVVAFQAPSAANNYTWYRKYKSGWVEQGGVWAAATINIAINSTVDTYIVLPHKMQGAHYTTIVSGGTDYCIQLGIYETKSNLFRMRWGAYGTTRQLTRFNWYVCGIGI